MHPLLCLCLGLFSLDLLRDFGVLSPPELFKSISLRNFCFLPVFPNLIQVKSYFTIYVYLNLKLLLLIRSASVKHSYFHMEIVPGSLFVAVLITSAGLEEPVKHPPPHLLLMVLKVALHHPCITLHV